MKLKYEFEKVELDGEIMAVPVGDKSDNLHAILKVNETASFILDCLKEETTEDVVAEKVLAEYEGDRDEIVGYVHEFIANLEKSDLLSK